MLALLTLVLTLSAPSASGTPHPWPVSGSDLTFEMSAFNLRLLRGDHALYDLRGRHQGYLKAFEPEPGASDTDRSDWEGHLRIKVLSVVGTWVSYQMIESTYAGGRSPEPYQSNSYVTEDARKPDQTFSLLDSFAEKDVVAALRADPFVQKYRTNATAFAAATTLAQLMAALGPGNDCVGFDVDRVSRSVAFHHLEGEQVAVRIGFPGADQSCGDQLSVVGVLLPVPKAWKEPLERAEKRTEGFLMKDVKSVPATTLQFDWTLSAKKKR